jgi:hypothetical protein
MLISINFDSAAAITILRQATAFNGGCLRRGRPFGSM